MSSTAVTAAFLASVTREQIEALHVLAGEVARAVDRPAAWGVRRAISELEAAADLLDDAG